MNKKIIALLVIVIAIIVIVAITIYTNSNKTKHEDLVATDPNNDEITVEDLKNELGATGTEDIYTVAEDIDGRKILAVKPSLEYSVAVAGILNEGKAFEFEDIDKITEKAPQNYGVWVSENSRQDFTKMINELTDSEYYVDNNGYLQAKEEKNNNYDNAINKLINGNKLYIIDISGKCYTIESMTGEIIESPFEEMDPYQTYQYYEDNDKMAIVITTNKDKKLTNAEIIDSIIELCK